VFIDKRTYHVETIALARTMLLISMMKRKRVCMKCSKRMGVAAIYLRIATGRVLLGDW
jgi:hypothetical protein